MINITGFAFAISICLAIALFLIKENSFDQHHENSDQIVRLIDNKNNSSLIDYRIKDILLANFPEIENGCLVQRVGHPIEVKKGDEGFYLDDIMSVDNNFFEVFSIPFTTGGSTSPFININSAVITESIAKTLFGTDSPLGKDILIQGITPVTITGIINDFPDNSSIFAGILVNAENENFKFNRWIGNSQDSSSYRWPFQVYLQLNNNVNADQLFDKINTYTDLLQPYIEQASHLILKDIYLRDTTSGSETIQGNADLLKLLAVIALIILTLAIINYVNLTIAQQHKRNKYTGVKKAAGANRSNILFQFLFESVIVTFLAFLLGTLLVWMLVPFYYEVFNTTLDINYLFRFPFLLILPGAIIIIGLVSGSGPAIALSGVSPVKVLGGSETLPGKKNYLRNFLTVFQFTISIILIFCVIIVQRQIKYVKHKNPGFNESFLIRLDVPAIQKNDYKKALALLEELRMSPYIKSFTVTSGVPGEIRLSMGSNMKNSDKNISLPCLLVDSVFLRTFEMTVIKGRNLKPGDMGKVCMLNEAAYNHFEFENLENKRINNYGGFDIIGVVNDFHYSSLHKTIGPVCIMFTPNFLPTAINIRFEKDGAGPGMDFIRNTWQKILPGHPLKYQFYDDWFDSMYRSEERFAKTIGLFALLAIIISCIGILGLAIFSSERRTKEIGIRKVNGAKIFEVMMMLNKGFVKWVSLAFAIAAPIAYYVMLKWLGNFAYKTELSWWIFGLAGILALVIALLTVIWQSWRAATRNPVEALRYE